MSLAVLAACGGKGSDTSGAVPTGGDREAPVIQHVQLLTGADGQPTVGQTSDGQPSIEISVPTLGGASDNIDVTAYCLTSSSNAPAKTDACFQETPVWKRPIGPSYRVWARDAAGNVSAGVRAPGPCSAAAVAAAVAATSTSSLPTVCVKTDVGEIVLELNTSKAPTSSKNIMDYVSNGFYAGTVFHRIMSDFMVQGGGTEVVNGQRVQKTAGLKAPITLEKTSTTGLSNTVGTVALARTSDPNSATSQFFINVVDNSGKLDANGTSAPGNGYAVFGRVIYGMNDAVQTLRAAQVINNSSGELSQPVADLYIRWAYLIQ